MTYLLDTNVVSETMRPRPSLAVMAWLREQAPEELYISSVTIGEIRFGLALLDQGERRADLTRRFNRFIEDGFRSRVAIYDAVAAHVFGAIAAQRRKSGRPISVPDAQIAAIATTENFALVTRNVGDFAGLGVALLNPFEFET